MLQMSNYRDSYENFDWSQVEEELDYSEGDLINIGWYCSDRICEQDKKDKLALIWEGSKKIKSYTFDELRKITNNIGSFLRELGINMGDRICLFMERIPELYFGVLSVLKIGAIAQPLFSAFGEESLHVRLEDAETRVVITQSRHLPKVRKIADKLDHLDYIIVVDYQDGAKTGPKEVILNIDDLTEVTDFKVAKTRAETPSLLHYTSGTTGKPKGVKHVHYSLISQYITAKWVLDLKDDDIYWCTADPGWVTGTSYGIIGPWSLGITQCILNKGFSARSWYEFIERHNITVWYSAPTAVRSLMRSGTEVVQEYDLSSLRHLASVGEPLNPEAVIWSEDAFGKPFHDTYWQTETGSIMVANYPVMEIKPGSMGKPFPGITGAVLNTKTFDPIDISNTIGLIAFRLGWPAMLRTYWNNDAIFQTKIKNGWYLTGDRAKIDDEGYFWFVGRDDDVINTAGHLVSPFEVESALLEHEAIVESAVVSKPDKINMEVVKAFVLLKDDYEPNKKLELDIMNFVRKHLSPLAMPQEIEFVDSIPKNKSGKIMRRIFHAKEWGEEIGDISTLDDDEEVTAIPPKTP